MRVILVGLVMGVFPGVLAGVLPGVFADLLPGTLADLPARAAGTGAEAPPPIRAVSLATILAAARAPGARAVLINIWATWCDPCQDELPDLLRFYRENRARGLRLVLISADDEDRAGEVRRVLTAAATRAGLSGDDFDALLFIKGDDDMKFIDGLDPRWSGALPATFLYDQTGRRTRAWHAPITHADLQAAIGARLGGPRLTNKRGRDKTGAHAPPEATTHTTSSRRKP